MKRWRVLSMVPLGLIAACDKPTKRADLAACEMKAMEVYPKQAANIDAINAAADFAFLCMEAKGYASLRMASRDCSGSDGHVDEIMPECYRKPWPWEIW